MGFMRRLAGQLQADRFELPEFIVGQFGGEGAGYAAGVLAADLTLHRPAGLGERQPDAASVGGVGVPGDEPAIREPVHHAGQRLSELSRTNLFSSDRRSGSRHLDSV